MANKKHDLEYLQEMRQEWQEIPEEAVPEKYRKTFSTRKKAVDMYIDGFSLNEVKNSTNISFSEITRFTDRTLLLDEKGMMYGYAGLIPRNRIATDKSAPHGLFSSLIETHPELDDFIKGNYFGVKKYTLEKNMNNVTLHKKFLAKCLQLGVQEHEYPFTTVNKGYVSLCQYLKKISSEDLKQSSKRDSKDNRQKILSTGVGTRHSRNAIYPFSTVQIDGHLMDLIYNVKIINIDGTVDSVPATRPWLIAAIDVSTRCILGYSLSQEVNYNQYDLLDAIRDAITPRKKLDFTIDGLSYPENGGFPSLMFPDLEYPMIDTVMLDNAKSHLSRHTVDRLTNALKISLNFGSVATPETRGIVERFFGSLESRGFHKLPVTTGSGSHDLKRKSPEKALQKYDISFDEIRELVEALIAEYNNTPNNGINGLSPLESMRKKIFEAGLFPCLADEETIHSIERLNYIRVTRIARGKNNGKRPYINYMGEEYRSREFSSTQAYLGQSITLLINPRDISVLEAYAKDGHYIGKLTARGELGQKSHSLKTRKAAKQLQRERGRSGVDYDTPISAYENHLRTKGKNSRRKATRADIIRREQAAAAREGADVDIDISANKTPDLPPHVPGDELDNMPIEEIYEKLW